MTNKYDTFDDMLDDTIPWMQIGNIAYAPSQVFNTLDPIEYAIAKRNWSNDATDN